MYVIKAEVRAYVCDSRTMDFSNLLDWIAIIHTYSGISKNITN